ncbi:hypothetical protein ID866_11501 [Astraeus odoratus]|nr:hypothetical protein ID866_11501 [Astraeus odoratus]
MALSRKPHEGPDEPRIGLSEQQYDEESKRNVQAWVSAHVIPSRVSLFEVPATYDTALEGKSVTFIRAPKSTAGSPDWARVTLEDGTRIAGMKEVTDFFRPARNVLS